MSNQPLLDASCYDIIRIFSSVGFVLTGVTHGKCIARIFNNVEIDVITVLLPFRVARALKNTTFTCV